MSDRRYAQARRVVALRQLDLAAYATFCRRGEWTCFSSSIFILGADPSLISLSFKTVYPSRGPYLTNRRGSLFHVVFVNIPGRYVLAARPHRIGTLPKILTHRNRLGPHFNRPEYSPNQSSLRETRPTLPSHKSHDPAPIMGSYCQIRRNTTFTIISTCFQRSDVSLQRLKNISGCASDFIGISCLRRREESR